MPSIANGTAQRPSPTMLSPLRSFIALIIVILLPLHIPQMDIQHQHGYYHYRYVRKPEYTGKRSHICKNPWRIALKINATASNSSQNQKLSGDIHTNADLLRLVPRGAQIHTSAAMSSKAKMIVRSAPDTISFTGSIAIARKANGESTRQAVTRLFMVRSFLPFGKLLTPAYLSGSYARRGEYSRAGYPRRR